jgi:hypothetical protein
MLDVVCVFQMPTLVNFDRRLSFSAQRSHFCASGATVFVFRSTVLPTSGNAPPADERLHCRRRWRTKRRAENRLIVCCYLLPAAQKDFVNQIVDFF